MLTELAAREKVIGVKQSARAIREGRAERVFLACDADPRLTESIRRELRRPPGGGRLHHGPAGTSLRNCRGRGSGGCAEVIWFFRNIFQSVPQKIKAAVYRPPHFQRKENYPCLLLTSWSAKAESR